MEYWLGILTGIMVALALGVATNLFLPQFRLRDWFSKAGDMLAKQSAQRAENRMEKLRGEPNQMTNYAESTPKVVLDALHEMIKLQNACLLGIFALGFYTIFIVRELLDPDPIGPERLREILGYLLIPLLIIVATPFFQRRTDAEEKLWELSNFPHYRAKKEKEIEELQQVVARKRGA